MRQQACREPKYCTEEEKYCSKQLVEMYLETFDEDVMETLDVDLLIHYTRHLVRTLGAPVMLAMVQSELRRFLEEHHGSGGLEGGQAP